MTKSAKKYRVIYNFDNTEAFYRYPAPATDEQLLMPVDEIRDTHVDALCCNVCAGDMIVVYPSKVAEMYDLREGDQGGMTPFAAGLQRLFSEGKDTILLYLEHARRLGLDFFASVRMNDSHHKSQPRGRWASRFWREHQEMRNWEVTNGRCYYNATLNYSFPEVRKRRSDVIFEVAETYDVDGMELDFGRNPYLFNPSEAWDKREVATGFLRDVRAELTRIGERRGRDLDVVIRVPFADDALVRGGIDLKAWMESGVADIFAPCNVMGNDFGQKIDYWKDVAESAGVLLYCGIEAYVAHNAPLCNHIVSTDPGEMRGLAQNYHCQGAHGIYMFNFPCRLSEVLFNPPVYEDFKKGFAEIGEPAALRGLDKTFTFYKDLPIELEVGRPAQYHQTLPFSVCEPDIAELGGRYELEFKVTGLPDRDALEFIINGRTLAPETVEWRRACNEILGGGKEVPKARCGHVLDPHYALFTLRPPLDWIECGDNTLGFFMPGAPLLEHTYMKVYELEVRTCYPRRPA